jgi:hypothetical protein
MRQKKKGPPQQPRKPIQLWLPLQMPFSFMNEMTPKPVLLKA